ncbi:MBL fold metallo-hydrolase [Pontibacter sp. 172403-2]|uniref:MBL fold metallo-hydrolase n=1 Tax=Pontibacter rufus TaxID=2791028 RepID=UPI0018AFBF94|nr:MBL fold metallo-hydrolase [Pontibacter sp. 172403-2]MBF9252652.1 MBL fold metallo-hydrolase [Pontibacter sp. 172403-2]
MNASSSKSHPIIEESFPVAPGLWGLKTVFVNMYFIAEPDGTWVMIDAGLYGYKHKIKKVAAEIFGEDARPKAILLTHGHFDHIGSLRELATEWQVPVYAHPLEFPYLTGKSSYPPPDPSVGGGAMAYMAFMYPKKPIDISSNLELLPADGSVPGLPGWRWLHTPGHTAGHVSFFRESDRTLVAGDAFITRDGESGMAVLTQKRKVHGPPAYYTSDWGAAQHSVEKLANLNPDIAATGHGLPMKGKELQWQLDQLVKDFWIEAVPERGRYVHTPAITDEQGVVSVPPPVSSPVPKVLAAAGAVALAGIVFAALKSRRPQKRYPTGGAFNERKARPLQHRPFSHNRVAPGFPPGIDPDHDNPIEHTNNYP